MFTNLKHNFIVVYLQVESILFAVSNKSAVLARIDVIVQVEKESLVKLKSSWISALELPDAVDKLSKDG